MSEQKTNNDLSRSNALQLLDKNELSYVADKTSNVVVERTQKKQFSERTVYVQNGTLVINFQTGVDYLDFCPICFTFKI